MPLPHRAFLCHGLGAPAVDSVSRYSPRSRERFSRPHRKRISAPTPQARSSWPMLSTAWAKKPRVSGSSKASFSAGCYRILPGCFLFHGLFGFCLIPSNRSLVLLALPPVRAERLRSTKPVPASRYSTETTSLNLLTNSLWVEAKFFNCLNRDHYRDKIPSLEKVSITFPFGMWRLPATRVMDRGRIEHLHCKQMAADSPHIGNSRFNSVRCVIFLTCPLIACGYSD
ncbi:hypothetical protein DSECCO2_597360 [anaerobic digester metagenome]